MAQTIQIKRGTGSAVPSGLADGELAINLDNGQLYFGSGSNSVNSFRFKNLTADNYIVSSSVTSITTQTLSGSTAFGDSADDTHQFTGNITASGDISASANIYVKEIHIDNQEAIAANSDALLLNESGLFSNGVAINRSNMTLPITMYGAVTASGHISSSGNLIAASIASHNHSIGFWNGTSISLGYENNTPIQIGKLANPTTIIGNVTASGNVSASGTITANSLTVAGNINANGNIVGDDNTTITNISKVEADEFLSDSDGATGIRLSDNLIKFSDTDDNENIFFNPVAGHITASGNISSSGTIKGNDYVINEKSLAGLENSDTELTLGYGMASGRINLGRKNATPSIFTNGAITASGNVSASGDIIGSVIYVDNSIIHTGDTNTGIQFTTDDTIDLNTGNSVRLRANDEGVTVTNGRLNVNSNITASGNVSASGLNHTFGGNVTIIKSGSDGDAVLTLFADTGNDNEAANPFIHLKQDIGGVAGQIGLTGDDDQWPSGHTLTGAKANSMVIGMTGSQSSNNRQLYLAAGNTASLEIKNNADVHIMNGDLKLDNANALYGGSHLLIKYDGEIKIGAGNRGLELNSTTTEVNGLTTFTSAITASSNISSSGIITGKLGTSDTNVDASHYTVLQTAVNTVPFVSNAFTINPSTNLVDMSNAQITKRRFAISSGTDGDHQGDVVFFGGTTSMTTGAIYHYKSDGTWELADADDNTKSDGLLGVALGAASDTNGVLLRGMVTLDHDPGAVGDPIYLTTTAGDASSTAPSGNGNIVRIIGYCLHATAGNIWFNPDSTFVEVNA